MFLFFLVIYISICNIIINNISILIIANIYSICFIYANNIKNIDSTNNTNSISSTRNINSNSNISSIRSI